MNYGLFSVSRPGENIEMASMSSSTTHQNQNLDDVQEFTDIGKISDSLRESETALHKGDQDNCDSNTCFGTVQVHSENAESEGNSFSQNIFSVEKRSNVL